MLNSGLAKAPQFSKNQFIIVTLLFALIGGIVIWRSLALNPNLPGDVNNDNVVNITDMSILLSNYGTNYSPADFNSSGLVDITDLSIVLTNFGKTYTSTIPSGSFLGTYYDNPDLTSQKLQRNDPTVNFDWALNAPDASMGVDTFSVRWEGNFNFESATYDFSTTTDDGVRLYIDNQLVIDKWIDQGSTTHTASKSMTSGMHIVRMEYFDNLHSAVAKLVWTKQTVSPPPPTPTPPPPPPSGTMTRFFYNDQSPWNQKIASNTGVVNNSSTWINNLYNTVGGININQGAWTPGIFYADSTTPKYNLINDNNWKLDQVPIPTNLQPSGDSDAHAIIVDRANNKEYDFFSLRKNSSGQWTAHSGVVFRLNGSGWYQPNPWAARAANTALGGGLILADDYKSGVINHALGCAAPKWLIANYGISPALTSDGSGGSSVMPMGSRLQLDPSLDINSLGLEPGEAIVAKAMQDYGIYIVDSTNSSVLACYAQNFTFLPGGANPYPSSWSNGVTKELIKRMRIVTPPASPVYDSRLIFGQPYQ